MLKENLKTFTIPEYSIIEIVEIISRSPHNRMILKRLDILPKVMVLIRESVTVLEKLSQTKELNNIREFLKVDKVCIMKLIPFIGFTFILF